MLFKCKQDINKEKHEFKHEYPWQMFPEELIVLGDGSVIEIGDAKIEQNVKQEWKIKHGKIKAIFNCPHRILHSPVNPQYPERLDQKIQHKQQNEAP